MNSTDETGDPMTVAALRDLIDAQQAQLTALRAEVDRLQGGEPLQVEMQQVETQQVETQQVQPLPARSHPGPRLPIGRRALFGKAAAVLAAGAGMAVVGNATPAFAGTDGDVVLGLSNSAADATQIVSTSSFFAFSGFNNSGGAGVDGFSLNGTGVSARSSTGNALAADCESSSNAFNGVYATTSGTGNAVFGEVNNASNTGNAVLGINHGTGNCVFGVKPAGVAGDAVVGVANGGRGVFGVSKTGRGGAFIGSKAQIQLLPSTATTHPASGSAGDLFVDSAKRLWFCKGATNWKQLA